MRVFMAGTMTMTYYHKHDLQADKYGDQADGYFNDFWKFSGDLTNKILFFILGVSIGGHLYKFPWKFIPILIIILVVSRSVVVYMSGGLFKVVGKSMQMSWLNVLNIAGLKGALSIALILLIPENYPHRDLFLCAAFVMILFSLIGNSLVMRWYLGRTELSSPD